MTEEGNQRSQRFDGEESADPPGTVTDPSTVLERGVISSDRVQIVYDVAGGGAPALVFVHGWCGRRGHWDEQVDAFSSDHLLVRVDLAGHGASGPGRDRWTVAAFADDVVAVVNAVAVDRVILIGHSLGGSVIVAAARCLGERVVGLIGIDTWSSIGVRAQPADIEASVLLPDMRADFAAGSARFVQLLCGPTTSPALVSRITAEVAVMPPHVALAIMDEGIRQGPVELEDGLRAIDVPKSAISSETFRPKDADILASFGIGNVVVPDTGHYLMLQRPPAFNRELKTAVARSAVR
jgi:pimeloyl-ACP methyl ester carboxylesterase